jgi:hypothetical protein
MDKIFEKAYSDEISSKDGGFIFQSIVDYSLSWSIVDGETVIDQNTISGWLNRVDIFPDMQFTEGSATLTYVILSEVNLLKRKFELASEAIKRLINPQYAKEMEGGQPENKENQNLPEPVEDNLKLDNNELNEVLFTTKLTSAQINEINNRYFKNTKYTVNFKIDNLVLREVSTSGLDTGSPNITLKLSTGMVDTLDGTAINNWDNFKVSVSGPQLITLTNTTEPKISEILVYDPIENINELIFRTIVPSLILDFRGNKTQIDNYSKRSTQVSVRSTIDFDNLFNIDETPKSEIIDTEEGEAEINKPIGNIESTLNK